MGTLRCFWPWALLLVLSACAPWPLPPKGPKAWEATLEGLMVLTLLGILALLAYLLWGRGLPGPTPSVAARLQALRRRAQGLPPERRQRLEGMLLEAWEALEGGRRREAQERLLRAEAYLELAEGEGREG